MVRGGLDVRKVTISLPSEILRYADDRAARLAVSRSQVIGTALAGLRAREEEELAREGYAFYAHQSEEFAGASIKATSEALPHVGAPTHS